MPQLVSGVVGEMGDDEACTLFLSKFHSFTYGHTRPPPRADRHASGSVRDVSLRTENPPRLIPHSSAIFCLTRPDQHA
ncbi:hypothetical protein DFH09DRAFT_1321910 [Mycena vulgaris]|nr:hypothetical protein DFH09DRAFT_1321910 [Mycena vulgaris]